MRRFSSIFKERPPLGLLIGLCWASVAVGVAARFYHLALPNKLVFDEVYFPVMANSLLHGVLTFDAHPPFGKMLIALGILVFGNTSLGWRIVPLLFGLGLMVLFPAVVKEYFKKEKDVAYGGLMIAAIVALECMLIVYSRLGLMDGVLVFFVMAAFLASLKAKEWDGLIALSILIGLAVSIKWLSLAVLVPIVYVMWRRGLLARFLATLPAGILTYVGIVFAGEAIGRQSPLWSQFVLWHVEVWNYETTLKATHPWGSVWWTWPIMYRPLLMLRDTLPDGRLAVINAIGNPLIWYGSLIAVVGSIVNLIRLAITDRPLADHPTMPLLLGWAAFWLPWSLVHRVLFIYTYLPAYAFSLLILVYWLMRGLRGYAVWVAAFMLVALGLTVFYLPELTGLPMTLKYLNAHVWIPSWI